jgi:hypothetical protein
VDLTGQTSAFIDPKDRNAFIFLDDMRCFFHDRGRGEIEQERKQLLCFAWGARHEGRVPDTAISIDATFSDDILHHELTRVSIVHLAQLVQLIPTELLVRSLDRDHAMKGAR